MQKVGRNALKLPSALVAAAICCLASLSAYAADVKLSGSAFYRERIALPQDAALQVELIDLAKPEIALGATTVAPAGQVPIAFGMVIDSSKLSKGVAYAMQARIEVGGSTWFASAEPIAVDPAKAGEPFSILLIQAPGGKGAQDVSGVSLVGTEWRILELDGKSADTNVTSTLAFDADGAVSGNGGCNTFRGSVDIEGTVMKFGQLASTMMACEIAKSTQEALFHAALSQTASHSVRDGELSLIDAAGKVVARLGEP
jgi:putative lipoprotein